MQPEASYSSVVPQSPQRAPTTPAPADQRGCSEPAQTGHSVAAPLLTAAHAVPSTSASVGSAAARACA